MPSSPTEAKSQGPRVREQVRRLRALDDFTNLGCLAREYACIAALTVATIACVEFRASRGLSWAWDVPVAGFAVVLLGALQHRLAGLGHEAMHYTLLTNRFWNDLVGDLFCLIPLLTNIHLYRAFHSAHHRHTNDPLLDPEMVHMGRSKRVGEFPMPRGRFIRHFHLGPLLSPSSLVRHSWAYFKLMVLGLGEDDRGARPSGFVATALGVLYLAGAGAMQWRLVDQGAFWSVGAGLAGVGLIAVVACVLPSGRGARPMARQPYSDRTDGALRLVFFTALFVVLGRLHAPTGGRSTAYVLVLWFVPTFTTLMYFMLLRDVYQHANADAGRLTNSRIFRPDPLTRWAVFVYGQDLHVTHHLFPTVPHYRLEELHELLLREDPDYASKVVECRGTFTNDDGRPTILDVLADGNGAGRA